MCACVYLFHSLSQAADTVCICAHAHTSRWMWIYGCEYMCIRRKVQMCDEARDTASILYMFWMRFTKYKSGIWMLCRSGKIVLIENQKRFNVKSIRGCIMSYSKLCWRKDIAVSFQCLVSNIQENEWLCFFLFSSVEECLDIFFISLENIDTYNVWDSHCASFSFRNSIKINFSLWLKWNPIGNRKNY